jgi:hypothetical protein
VALRIEAALLQYSTPVEYSRATIGSMEIQFKLKNFLEANQVTPYALAQKMGTAHPTIYRLLRSTTPRQYSADMLAGVIAALRTLTGKPVSIADLLEYKEEEAATNAVSADNNQPLTAAGVPYTGDQETDEILNSHPDILERIARIERGEGRFFTFDELLKEHGITLVNYPKPVSQ